jgi:hypothetical protein
MMILRGWADGIGKALIPILKQGATTAFAGATFTGGALLMRSVVDKSKEVLGIKEGEDKPTPTPVTPSAAPELK